MRATTTGMIITCFLHLVFCDLFVQVMKEMAEKVEQLGKNQYVLQSEVLSLRNSVCFL